MNCPRNELFAGAGLSMYQYARVGIGHHPNPVPNLPQTRACANHLAGAEIDMAQPDHLRNRCHSQALLEITFSMLAQDEERLNYRFL